MEPLVKMVNIWKRFGAVEALRGASFHVFPAEVVGLVGDNGAGKSTLMKILAGVYQPDKGEIYLEGKRVNFRSAFDARVMGIEMVFQNLALAPKQTVAENIFLGREPVRSYVRGLIRIIDRKTMFKKAKILLSSLAIHVDDIRRPVSQLSGGQQQSVAIARALSLSRIPKLIIMDEPTAALAVQEVRKVLDLVRELRKQGIAVVLISHRLPDVFEVSDRVVVMRRGKTVANLPTCATSLEEVVTLIIGAKDGDVH